MGRIWTLREMTTAQGTSAREPEQPATGCPEPALLAGLLRRRSQESEYGSLADAVALRDVSAGGTGLVVLHHLVQNGSREP